MNAFNDIFCLWHAKQKVSLTRRLRHHHTTQILILRKPFWGKFWFSLLAQIRYMDVIWANSIFCIINWNFLSRIKMNFSLFSGAHLMRDPTYSSWRLTSLKLFLSYNKDKEPELNSNAAKINSLQSAYFISAPFPQSSLDTRS